MRKATFVMSAFSFAASAATLAIVAKGVHDTRKEVEALRTKTNTTINKMKAALIDFSV